VKPETRQQVQQLIELIAAFNDLRRRRDNFINSLGDDFDMNLLVAEATDAMATHAFMSRHPAGRVDAEAFRWEVRKSAIDAAVELDLFKDAHFDVPEHMHPQGKTQYAAFQKLMLTPPSPPAPDASSCPR
jgi:hypothetical protein